MPESRFRTIQDRPKDFPPRLRHGELAEPPSSALGGGKWRRVKTIGRWRTGQRSSLLGALPPAHHKRFWHLHWTIWRSLLSTVSRQPRGTNTCARILQASEINFTG